ncbi:MAG: hypothetical protein AB7K41_13875 [Bdellovibrionales bacterium]
MGSLREEMASLRLEMSGFKESMREEMKAFRQEVKSDIAAMMAKIHQTHLLIEEQNNRNKIVLDGLTSLFARQERLENIVLHGKTT